MTTLDEQYWTTYRAEMNARVKIEAASAAIVTIDMQREFLDRQVGANPLAPDQAAEVIRSSIALLEWARKAGLPVVHVYVARWPCEQGRGLEGPAYTFARSVGLSQSSRQVDPARDDRPIGSSASELVDGLSQSGDILVTTKKTPDSFLGTELEMLLTRALRVTDLLVCGVNTDTCVLSTAFSAANRGYRTFVISDCVGSMRGQRQHEIALELMAKSFAWVLTSAEARASTAQE
jgi:biuret amidohydrolase